MKLLIVIIALICIPLASALPAGIVVQYPDGKVDQECVHVPSGSSAYDALKASSFKTEWQGLGAMAFLTSFEGVPNEGNDAWSFWMKDGDKFVAAQVGLGGYRLGVDDVFVVSWASFAPPDYQPTPQPDFVAYDDVCALTISSLRATVDGKRARDADETGGEVTDVKPLSEIVVTIELSHGGDGSVDGAVATGTIFDVDGEDLVEESDSVDVRRSKDVTLRFTIPAGAEEDTYPMLIELDGGRSVRSRLSLSVDVNRAPYDVRLASIDMPEVVTCGQRAQLDITIANAGDNDQDVAVTISGSNGVIDRQNETIDQPEVPISFQIPPFSAEGDYPIMISLRHKGGYENVSRTISVKGCLASVQNTLSTQGENTLGETAPNPHDGESAYRFRPVQPAQVWVEQKTDYTPLIILGALSVVLIVAVVIVLTRRRG